MSKGWIRQSWHSDSTENYAAIKNEPSEGHVATWKCLCKIRTDLQRKMQSLPVFLHNDSNPKRARTSEEGKKQALMFLFIVMSITKSSVLSTKQCGKRGMSERRS